MDSKKSIKNIKKPAEDTNLSWEKHDRLISKYLRESEYMKQKQNQKK